MTGAALLLARPIHRHFVEKVPRLFERQGRGKRLVRPVWTCRRQIQELGIEWSGLPSRGPRLGLPALPVRHHDGQPNEAPGEHEQPSVEAHNDYLTAQTAIVSHAEIPVMARMIARLRASSPPRAAPSASTPTARMPNSRPASSSDSQRYSPNSRWK